MASLPPTMTFSPWRKGVFKPAPDLKVFGTDFGNGVLDQLYFPLTQDFARYRANKEEAIQHLGRHVLRAGLAPDLESEIALWILAQFHLEHPELVEKEGGKLRFLHNGDLIDPADNRSLLDQMALQIQEDLAIVQLRGESDTLSYLHLCAPSHWAGEDKIGKSFFDVHQPVPHIDPVNRVAHRLLQQCVTRGPFVRFVWSIEQTDKLNQHPAVHDPRPMKAFESSPIFLRTERQTLIGFPAQSALLFTIRVGHQPLSEGDLHGLAASLRSMSPEERAYKGIDVEFETLLRRVEEATQI